MTCPRCGAVIDGFPCSQCGFPVTFKPRKLKLRYRLKRMPMGKTRRS